MASIEEYLSEKSFEFGGRALIVGKGPSFHELDLSKFRDYFVVGLNETPLAIKCHAAFVIDQDILDSAGERLLSNVTDALITPRIPHKSRVKLGGLVIYGPSSDTDESVAWRQVAGSRLRLFNLATVTADPLLGSTYPAYNFSAPTLAYLLAANGFKRIGLAGVDGGRQYSAQFQEFEYKKLKSIQNSFDAQFSDLRAVRMKWGVEFFSVRCTKASVLIGAEPEQILAEEVLKWSIESNTFLSIEYCSPPSDSRSMYVEGSVGTPFSLQRLFMPKLANYQGRGVYFDSDMLVSKDVYELFNTEMEGNVLLSCEPTPGRRPQYSVFVVDNEKAEWDPDRVLSDYQSGQLSYEELMREFCFAKPKVASLPWYWNSLEIYEPNITANIHFTDMGTQPWLSIYNPNSSLWCEALFRAIDERPAVVDALQHSIDMKWVRPSLKWQVDHGKSNPWKLPASVKQLDKEWLPPHVQLRTDQSSRRVQILRWKLASRVRRLMQSRSYVRMMKMRYAIRKIF